MRRSLLIICSFPRPAPGKILRNAPLLLYQHKSFVLDCSFSALVRSWVRCFARTSTDCSQFAECVCCNRPCDFIDLGVKLECYSDRVKLNMGIKNSLHVTVPTSNSSGAPGMRRAVMGFGAGCGVGSSWVICSQDFTKK